MYIHNGFLDTGTSLFVSTNSTNQYVAAAGADGKITIRSIADIKRVYDDESTLAQLNNAGQASANAYVSSAKHSKPQFEISKTPNFNPRLLFEAQRSLNKVTVKTRSKVTCLRYANLFTNSNLMAAIYKNGEVYIITNPQDVNKCRIQQIFKHANGLLLDFSWSADDQLMAFTSMNNEVIIYDVIYGKIIATLYLHTNSKIINSKEGTTEEMSTPVKGITFDKLGNNHLFTLGDDKILCVVKYKLVYDEILGRRFEYSIVNEVDDVITSPKLNKATIKKLSISPDDKHLVCPNTSKSKVSKFQFLSHDEENDDWKIKTEFIASGLKSFMTVFSPNIYKNDQNENFYLISTLAPDSAFSVWRSDSFTPLYIYIDPTASVSDMCWSADGSMVFLTHTNGAMSVVVFGENEFGKPLYPNNELSSELHKMTRLVLPIEFEKMTKWRLFVKDHPSLVQQKEHELMELEKKKLKVKITEVKQEPNPVGTNSTPEILSVQSNDIKSDSIAGTSSKIISKDNSKEKKLKEKSSKEKQSKDIKPKEKNQIEAKLGNGDVSKNEKPMKKEKPKNSEKSTKFDKSTEIDIPIKNDKPTKTDKTTKADKSNKTDKVITTNKPVKSDNQTKIEKSSKVDKSSKTDKSAKIDKSTKIEKPAKIDKSTRSDKPTKADKLNKNDKSDLAVKENDTSSGTKESPKKLNSSAVKPAKEIPKKRPLPVSNFDLPSNLVPKEVNGKVVKMSKKDATPNAVISNNPITTKKKRENENVEFVGSIIVNPQISFSNIRIATPKLRNNINYKLPDNDSLILQVKNGNGLESQPTRISLIKEVSKGDNKQIFVDFVPHKIHIVCGSSKYFALSTSTGHVITYTEFGRRILPPIVLGSPLSFLELKDAYLLAVTSTGELFVWNLDEKKSLFKPVSLHPLLQPLYLSGQASSVNSMNNTNPTEPIDNNTGKFNVNLDQCDLVSVNGELLTRSENLTICSITSQGIPIVTLSNGNGYLFNKMMNTWSLISDSWWAFGSQYWDSSLTIDHIKDVSLLEFMESHTNEEITRRGKAKFFTKISKMMLMREGYENLETIISLNHLENKINFYMFLNDYDNYKTFLIIYAKRLSELNLKNRLLEILNGLFVDMNGEICGHPKNKLLVELILSCSRHREVQHILVQYSESIGLLNLEDDSDLDIL